MITSTTTNSAPVRRLIISCAALSLSQFAFGQFPQPDVDDDYIIPREPAAPCGNVDSRNAICYLNSHPDEYARSRAVVRLLINDGAGNFTPWCTGWFVGNEGHIVTNWHCIDSQAEADDFRVEILAEGATCATNCSSSGACGGRVLTESITFITTDRALDFTLLQINNAPLGETGFLQLRRVGADLNEEIYIPQHPNGFGRQISKFTDQEGDRIPTVQRIDAPNCQDASMSSGIEYTADTDGGSSGSPVIGVRDHLVVGLHNCASLGRVCPNRGTNISAIVDDFEALLPPSAFPCVNNDCPEFLNLTVDVQNGQTSVQGARLELTATNTIRGEADYSAGTRVTLPPGFRAQQGSTFRGHIQPCQGDANCVVARVGSRSSAPHVHNIVGDDAALIPSVQPNPARNQVTVLLPDNSALPATVKVLNGNGALLLTRPINGYSVEVGIEDLPPGVLFLQIIEATGAITNHRLIHE